MNKQKLFVLILSIATGAAGYFLGNSITTSQKPEMAPVVKAHDEANYLEMREGGYQFISPLLDCECYEPSKLLATGKMEAKISVYIQQVRNENKVVQAAVYFRDLNNGPWMAINKQEKFTPASLQHVPLLIAALKKAESNPVYLKEKLKFKQGFSYKGSGVFANNTHWIQKGESYTVEDLLKRMNDNSDEYAADLVRKSVGDELLKKVIEDFGMAHITNESSMVTIKDYSSYFRILFNASYLNAEMSQKAIEILIRPSFKEGIVAGVPKDLVVANKYAETEEENIGLVQLHEVGIVYAGATPYLLCVMTMGKDFKQLASVIAGISTIVYTDVSSR